MSMILICFVVLLGVLPAICTKATFHTSSSAPYFLDTEGRPAFFHGTNFVEKGFPWYPAVLLNETNIQTLASMGINTVRLGFMWTGAEPQRGVKNQTYYDIMGGIVDTLAKYDIYAFLDVHQDVMSTYFCLYDGFPTWAVDESVTPNHAHPWPLPPAPNGYPCDYSRGWASNYLSEACGTAFQTLYTENSQMQQDFVNFWKNTATYFKDKPLLGYEIINEPWAGNIYQDPKLLLPGHAGKSNLMPLYDIVSSAIREIDDSHVILYEPVTWGMIFNGDVLGSGFDHVPGGDAHKDKSAFSFHYYCWWYGNDDMQKKTCDQLFGPKVFEQAAHDVATIGGAAMLTEWGQGCAFDTDNPADPNSECNQIMGLADKHFMSWTDWYFGGHLNEQNFQMSSNSKQMFSRVYARAVAGIPKKMNFDVSTKAFELCFEQDSNITSDITEIFVPFSVHYPQGIQLEVSANLKLVSQDEKTGKILIKNRALNDDEVNLPRSCINITAK